MSSKLFQPLKVGQCSLSHRIVMAPLTRYRNDDNFVPLPMVKEYYGQRASVPGTLLISEATYISEKSIGEGYTPGLFTDEQIAAWREITTEVHSKGSFIYVQLWAQGRAAELPLLKSKGLEHISSSATPIDADGPVPRALEESEILEYIEAYAQAARNAICAGFDGVEIHGANGYLIDQFTQDTCNKRTDRWGGSIENRARFAVEVVKAVCAAIGPDRTAIRLSPWSTFQGMLMKDPVPQYTYLLNQLEQFGLSYLHVVQPRVHGDVSGLETELTGANEQPFVPEVWGKSSPLFLAGGFTPDSATDAVDKQYPDIDACVVFGRYFISNPDLPYRVQNNIKLAEYDRATFYTPLEAKGYTDYPFAGRT